MANRGSYNYKPGDPIYAIEVITTHQNGEVTRAWKTFPSESGFKAGLRAVKDDVKRWSGWIYSKIEYETYKAVPQWSRHRP